MVKSKRFLLALIFLSLIFPVIKLYYVLYPTYTISLDEVTKVGEKIKLFAETNKLKGVVKPIERISPPESPDKSLDKFKDKINAILVKYEGWKVAVNDEEKKRLIAIMNKYMKENPVSFTPEEIEKLDSSKVSLPNYQVFAKWEWESKSTGKCVFTFKIYDIMKQTEMTGIDPVEFTHPEYEAAYLRKYKAITYGTYISSGIFSIAFILFLINTITVILKRKKLENLIPDAKQKCQEYIEKGSYTAADSLIKEQLEYFPKNTDFISYQERLNVVTKNNPRRAEEAYVRYINLGTKLTQIVYLTDEEYDDLKKLLQYLELPEITELIAKYQKVIEQENMRSKQKEICNKVKFQQERIKVLVESGELSKAKEEISTLNKDEAYLEYKSLVSASDFKTPMIALPAPNNLEDLENEAEQKIRQSKESFNQINEYINKGKISEAEKLLEAVAKTNKDYNDKVREILNKIEKSRKAEKLILKPEKIGKEILVFKKDTITLARKDKKMPDIDINNPKVSRDNHLKLCIVESKVLAEDLNSAGGTYHRGEKITRSQVEDGDVIDLAKAYRMTVHICRGREIVQSTLVQGTIAAEMKIDRRDIEEHQKISGLFIEADDRNIIVLAGKEPAGPITFKSIGIVYEKSGDCLICVKDGVIMLQTPEGSQIIYDGAEIDYKGVRYKIA